VLELAAGGNPELSPVERSRARKRLADNGLAGLADKLRSRSERREIYAHPAALDRIGNDVAVVRGGVSTLNAHDFDLNFSDEVEIYIRSSKVADLVDRYALEPDADDERSRRAGLELIERHH